MNNNGYTMYVIFNTIKITFAGLLAASASVPLVLGSIRIASLKIATLWRLPNMRNGDSGGLKMG